MAQQLSLSARPRILDNLVGQEHIINAIRGLMQNERPPKAFLLSGPYGCGKSSTAEIIALSYQCEHQQEWGRPCRDCLKNKSRFLITEISSASLSGKVELREALQGSELSPFAGSKYRVYILDEVHRANIAAQSLLLRAMEEDTPETTIFILCTTDPQNLLEGVRNRCICYQLRELDSKGIETLVTRLLKKVKSTLPVDRLVEALEEARVKSPRLICHAVEKYVGGASLEETVKVDAIQAVDTKAIGRALIKGDWGEVSKYLVQMQSADAKGVRAGLQAYLKKIVLTSPEADTTNVQTAKALGILCQTQAFDDYTLQALLAANLCQICAIFGRYSR